MLLRRDEFLAKLESLRPGLSSKEILEQSASFVFQSGQAYTFNGEVACRCPSGLEIGFQGAVRADKLLNVLRKRPEEELEIVTKPGSFSITSKERSTEFHAEEEIKLPVSYVQAPDPDSWTSLDDNFAEAVFLAKECAGKDHANFLVTCVHLHPHRIEATDTCQVICCEVTTGVEKPLLVRRDSIKHLVGLPIDGYSLTQGAGGASWAHYRASTGLVLSFSCWPLETEVNLAKHLECSGISLKLPKGVKLAAELAGEFSSENPIETNLVRVDLVKNKILIEGAGITGCHREKKKLDYLGPPVSFYMSPKLLADIADRYTELQVCGNPPDRLKVEGDGWKYVSFLTRA